MAVRPIVISEPLCFLTMKRGRFAVKQLKSLLYDFYSGDVVSAAKDVLLDAIAAAKIDGAPKIVRRRRDSKDNPDAKIRLDIDDLVTTVTYLDENNLVEKLPIFVAADPDMIPSARLLEGDLFVVLNKLEKIEQSFSTFQTELEAIRSCDVRGGAAAGAERVERRFKMIQAELEAIRLHGARGEVTVNTGQAVNKNKDVNKTALASVAGEKGGSTAVPLHLQRHVMTESDCFSSARESEGEADANDFTHVESNSARRMRRKRLRESNSPVSPSYATMAASNLKRAEVIADTLKKPTSQRVRQVMIGHSTTSNMKASKNLNVRKSIYRVSNIDACYTAEDLQQYIESLGVRVVSCFDRTSTKSTFADNKTFRVCILDIDSAALLCDSNWYVGISIEKWKFKPKDGSSGQVAGKDSTAAEGGISLDTGAIFPPSIEMNGGEVSAGAS